MERGVGDGCDVQGKTVAVSGSGNVAQYTTEKLIQLGAKVVSLSDSSGTVIQKSGFTTKVTNALLVSP